MQMPDTSKSFIIKGFVSSKLAIELNLWSVLFSQEDQLTFATYDHILIVVYSMNLYINH